MAGIKVGSNIASLTAQRRLAEATSSVSSATEKLSSGQRITKASDDAAGLAIASSLNSKSRVFTQAVRNLNDGISFFSVTEGAVQELKTILMRQRELSTEASNGTFSDGQRTSLHKELDQLSKEYNRILEGTAFNGRTVFSKTEGGVVLQCGYGIEGTLSGGFESNEAKQQIATQRISVSANESEGNNHAIEAALSSDSRYVAFSSQASNLVSGDTNNASDIFLRDLLTGGTTRISLSSTGGQVNGASSGVSMTPDGKFVAFASTGTNLIAGGTNGQMHVFVRNLLTGETKIASVDSAGVQGDGGSRKPVLTPDGRYVAFISDATNLAGAGNDTNDIQDIFVHDFLTGQTSRVSVLSDGSQAEGWSDDPSISADGRYIAFDSNALNLTGGICPDVFVHDTVTGETDPIHDSNGIGHPSGTTMYPTLSENGRYVVFCSDAANVVDDDNNFRQDIFVTDLVTGKNTRVSLSSSGVEANDKSFDPSISADGRYVVFASDASNLVAGDTNNREDVFVRDMQTGETRRISTSASGAQANNSCSSPTISRDGRFIRFSSVATNLVSGDNNGKCDQFIAGNPFENWSEVARSIWLSVCTREDALASQEKIDEYLNELSSVEGQMGALMTRLDTAVSNLSSMKENSQAAESRIRDADIADEAANYQKNQILQQVGQAILAQANQAPRIALDILRSA